MADGSRNGIAGLDTAARVALCLKAAEIAEARAYLLTDDQRGDLLGNAWLLTTAEAITGRIDRRARAKVPARDDSDPRVLARVVINDMDVTRWRRKDVLDSVHKHEQVSLLADGTIPIWARGDDPEDTDETPLTVLLALEATAIQQAKKRVALRVKQRAWAAKTKAKARAAKAVAQGGAA